MRAAIMWEAGKPLTIEDVTTSDIRPDEVRVATRSVGLCHSDLHVLDGHLTRPLPMILGHEASGIVTETGADVSTVNVGDPVVVCLVAYCGTCRWCQAGDVTLCGNKSAINRTASEPRRLEVDGQEVHQFSNVGALAEEMIVHHTALTVMPKEMPIDVAALLGCAVATGVGTVERVANVRPGQSVAVIGCGGVGLNLVQAAQSAGAEHIVAIDLDEQRRTLAVDQFGATEAVDGASPDEVAAKVVEITGGGADHVFDAVGRTSTTLNGLDMAVSGGSVYAVGIYPEGGTLEVPVAHFHRSKSIIGVRMGAIIPQQDLPDLAQRYLDGRLSLDHLISRRVPLEEVNESFEALRSVDGARTVVVFPEQ